MNLPNPLNSADDVHLLAGAYALNAVDEFERRRFEAHLPSCESCQSELASFAGAVDVLGAAAHEPAPASLKASVMAEVDQTRQDSPVASSTQRSARRSNRILGAVAAIAVLAAVAAGSLFVNAERRADNLAEIAAVYQAPDAQTIELTAGDARLRVSLAGDDGRAIIDPLELGDLEDGQTYQLWMVADAAFAESTFVAGDPVLIDLAHDLIDGAVLAVTVEPAGGSPQPTTDPIAVSEPIQT